MYFEPSAACKISSTYSDSVKELTIGGISYENTGTPDNAKTQIDKILAIINKSIKKQGMKRIVTEEAWDN